MDDLAEEEGFFDRSVLRDDTQQLTSFYNNYGYAFADAGADLNKDDEENQIHITYRLTKKHKVFVRRVTISGNQKTRDNVIRRELRLTGGELFSGARLAVSKQRLQRLDFFETVEIETQPTEEPDQMDLKVKVKEKSTGSFSAGAGFSTIDNVFFTAQVQERNVLGKGYSASLRGSFSSISSRFQLSFWNPHFRDGPLGLGFDAFSTTREYDDYDLDSTGGKIKFAYTLGDYTRLFWNYRLEQYSVENIDFDASEQIKDIEGDNLASSVYAAISRDTTNKRLNPTRGTKNTVSAEYAGSVLGGDDDFIKTQYEFSYFHPIFWKLVFNWHWKIGHLFENTGDPVPDFERFYLGGINTVRGYDYRDISATDDAGDDIGGYKTFYTNVETTFPIKEDMGLLGVVFFDAGDVWDEDEDFDTDLYKSVGAGIRWNSPLGPLRLEYGYPLDDLKGNDGKFEFSVGQFF
jgi:outer membrane protein insertion porin family